MKLQQIIKQLDLQVAGELADLDRQVSGGYASDLLSDVIANAEKDNIWITLQIHQNVVAVATLKELAGIVIVGGRKPAEETLAKAEQENIPIVLTELGAFEIIGKLYKVLGRC